MTIHDSLSVGIRDRLWAACPHPPTPLPIPGLLGAPSIAERLHNAGLGGNLNGKRCARQNACPGAAGRGGPRRECGSPALPGTCRAGRLPSAPSTLDGDRGSGPREARPPACAPASAAGRSGAQRAPTSSLLTNTPCWESRTLKGGWQLLPTPEMPMCVWPPGQVRKVRRTRARRPGACGCMSPPILAPLHLCLRRC